MYYSKVSIFKEQRNKIGSRTQVRCRRLWRPSLSVISATLMAFWSKFVSIPFNIALRRATYGQILLVGEDQEKGVPQLILVEHALQLLAGLGNTVTIVAVDDEDDTLGVLEVVSPQRANLVLSTDIPHGELDVAVLDGLDIEA